jgi:hypothetical protein
MIGVHFSDKTFVDNPIRIPTVLPKRTFLEKAFLLHEEFQKPTELMRVERLSRHLYDLEQLMNTTHAIEALEDTDLYRCIVNHRLKFNPSKWIGKDDYAPDKIAVVPPREVIREWEKDYVTMQNSMIYGDSRKFAEVIARLKELNQQFRKLKI